jgi:hypothetical protein
MLMKKRRTGICSSRGFAGEMGSIFRLITISATRAMNGQAAFIHAFHFFIVYYLFSLSGRMNQ